MVLWTLKILLYCDVNLGPAGPGPGGARGPHELCYLGIYGPRLADDEFKFVLSYRQYD